MFIKLLMITIRIEIILNQQYHIFVFPFNSLFRKFIMRSFTPRFFIGGLGIYTA
jgi:hypothetical protein